MEKLEAQGHNAELIKQYVEKPKIQVHQVELPKIIIIIIIINYYRVVIIIIMIIIIIIINFLKIWGRRIPYNLHTRRGET